NSVNHFNGSERRQIMKYGGVDFLSCLYGSEHGFGFISAAVGFLSCLYGSELLQNKSIRLVLKEQFLNTSLYPFLSYIYNHLNLRLHFSHVPKGYKPYRHGRRRHSSLLGIWDFLLTPTFKC
ncbi:hypothetical protein ABRZ24_17335, partial [Brenneria populi]|nr:hypothetical protein [Brenneria populi Li et al. 2015]